MAVAVAEEGLFRRPTATTGRWSWFTTVDHKKIGIMYCATALAFFLIGGLEALAIRTQLAVPNGATLTADAYNQFFTMHGLTMIFMVVMPLGVGIMNYIIPLLIGA
ncbi:MAG: cbb3-type cytochrome c oxidase subunit I, partial [Actinomycetota bacterium]